MTRTARRGSLRWRLPLLICAIVAIAIGAFAAGAYDRMQGALIDAGAARAAAAAGQLAALLVESAQQRITQLTRLSADPALSAFATRPTPDRETGLRARLESVTSSLPQSIEIWSADARLLLAVGGSGGDAGERGPAPSQTGVLPFRITSAGLATEAAVAIPSAADPSETVGYLLLRRPITGGQNAAGIRQLVGPGAIVRVGSAGGVWTDLAAAADAPAIQRVGVTSRAESRESGFVTATAPVNGTPWLASVSFPLATTIAPARRLLAEGVIGALLVMAFAAIAGYVLTGRVTRPLAQLSDAAEAIAGGDYTRRVRVDRTDEIGRLAAAFNTMAAQVDDMHARLESRVTERTRELEAFSYSVSHDLRAPLRHVVGFAQLLEKQAGPTLDAEGNRYLRTIMNAAGRMGRLIDDLLAFSRMGRAELQRQEVSLNALVEEARAEIAVEHEGRAIEWHVADLPQVHGDPSLLRLVFVNLLSNAVKYTAPRDVAQIHVSAAHDANGDTIVAIRDNGVGFDPEYAPKLFGVFQRLHRADEFAGTGIGLANVRQIVHRHGGRTWAEGEVDRGATFYFSLPPAGAQPAEAS